MEILVGDSFMDKSVWMSSNTSIQKLLDFYNDTKTGCSSVL